MSDDNLNPDKPTINIDTEFESIKPWDGAHDTGYDARMKLDRNFARVKGAIVQILEYLGENVEGLEDKFISKIKPDSTRFLVQFFAGLEAGLYAAGGTDGSKLHEDGLAELGKLQVNGDSEFRGNLSSQEFIAGFLTGKGWAIQMRKYTNASGEEEYKSVAEFDELIVRGTMRVFEFVVSQLLGENDNRIFTAMLEVDHYDAATGKVYLDTKDKRLYNPFRVDDYIMVQQYNGMPSADNNHYITKQYELIVTEVGTEDNLAWVKFRNFTTTVDGGTPQSLIVQKDTFVRIDNLSDPDRKGIIQMMTVGDGTPYMDVAYGLKTDPDNALKARVGRLEGIYNSLFGWLQSWGAYLINLYAVGEYRQRNTGEDFDTKIEMLKHQFLSQYKTQYYDLTEEENFLHNASFTNNHEGWQIKEKPDFVTLNDNPLYVNRSLVIAKYGYVGVEERDGKYMLRISGNGVTQANSLIAKPGTHKEIDPETEEEIDVPDTLYLSLKAQFVTSGTLKMGFETASVNDKSLPFVEEEISALSPNEYKTIQVSGTWDGTGDFQISYTGDMFISILALTTRPLDNFEVTTRTWFKQTATTIGIYGENIDNLNQTATQLGIEIDAAKQQISIYASKVDNLEESVTNLGIDIDALNEQLTIYADKISDNEADIASLQVTTNSISSTVSSVQGDLEEAKLVAAAASQAAQDAADAAMDRADSAYLNAYYAQQDADAAYDKAVSNASAISQNADSISAIAGLFDEDGHLLEGSGWVTTSNFNSLYSLVNDINGELLTKAEISTSVQYNPSTGKITSNITLTADQIDINGVATINDNFRVETDGTTHIGGFTVSNQGLINNTANAFIEYEGNGRKAALGKAVSATWSCKLQNGSTFSITAPVSMSCISEASQSENYALQVCAKNGYNRNVAIIATAGIYAGFRMGCFIPSSTSNTYATHYGNVILFTSVTYNTVYLPAFGKEDDGLVLLIKNAIMNVDDTPECWIVPWSGYKIMYNRNSLFYGKYTGSGTVDNSYGLMVESKGDAMMLVFRYSDKTFYQFKFPRDW